MTVLGCFLCFGQVCQEDIFFIVYVCLHIISIITISFCSLCVLCILIRPGPRDQDRNRDRVDQSKQRAFYTTVVLLDVLVLRFASTVIWGVLNNSEGNYCLIMTCFFLRVHFASSLVLRLLFLHRTGKLTSCSNKTATKNKVSEGKHYLIIQAKATMLQLDYKVRVSSNYWCLICNIFYFDIESGKV